MDDYRVYNMDTFIGFEKLPIKDLLAFALKDSSHAEESENTHDLMAISLAKMILQNVRYAELVLWLEKENSMSYSEFPKKWILRAAGIPQEEFFKDEE